LPFIPKFPPGCSHLDLKEVERVLVRHRANINEAAKELGVSRTDLRRLTWHNPKLLEEALLWCDVYVSRCHGLLIEALDSKSRRRREWASDKLLSSSLAYGHLFASALAPAPRARVDVEAPDDGRLALEQEAAAELERERVVEQERELAMEIEGDRETETAVVEIECPREAPIWRDADPLPKPVEPPPVSSELPSGRIDFRRLRSWPINFDGSRNRKSLCVGLLAAADWRGYVRARTAKSGLAKGMAPPLVRDATLPAGNS